MAVAQGFDNSNATVAAIAAPGAGKRIVYKRIKINVLEADTVIVKSATTELDRYILPANGLAVEAFERNDWVACATNEALNLTKTAATDMAYRIVYGIETV